MKALNYTAILDIKLAYDRAPQDTLISICHEWLQPEATQMIWAAFQALSI